MPTKSQEQMELEEKIAEFLFNQTNWRVLKISRKKYLETCKVKAVMLVSEVLADRCAMLTNQSEPSPDEWKHEDDEYLEGYADAKSDMKKENWRPVLPIVREE